ncbi:carbohydrate binding domain-containing protein [Patescibacteria group bacterium]|nr:carbohydrate binding domain-containing protein [Patescibacteria group bacterium]MBU1721632.1 carbohydrate binding domain-containing protein [Patescibacteria group bacterium]MBU1901706.1 carbohydrate binding domain-containing protein [Patescibacteria group bacterium]
MNKLIIAFLTVLTAIVPQMTLAVTVDATDEDVIVEGISVEDPNANDPEITGIQLLLDGEPVDGPIVEDETGGEVIFAITADSGDEEVVVESLIIDGQEETPDFTGMQLYLDGEPVDGPIVDGETASSSYTVIAEPVTDGSGVETIDIGDVEMIEGYSYDQMVWNSATIPEQQIPGEGWDLRYDGVFDDEGNYHLVYKTGEKLYTKIRNIQGNWSDAELVYDYASIGGDLAIAQFQIRLDDAGNQHIMWVLYPDEYYTPLDTDNLGVYYSSYVSGAWAAPLKIASLSSNIEYITQFHTAELYVTDNGEVYVLWEDKGATGQLFVETIVNNVIVNTEALFLPNEESIFKSTFAIGEYNQYAEPIVVYGTTWDDDSMLHLNLARLGQGTTKLTSFELAEIGRPYVFVGTNALYYSQSGIHHLLQRDPVANTGSAYIVENSLKNPYIQEYNGKLVLIDHGKWTMQDDNGEFLAVRDKGNYAQYSIGSHGEVMSLNRVYLGEVSNPGFPQLYVYSGQLQGHVVLDNDVLFNSNLFLPEPTSNDITEMRRWVRYGHPIKLYQESGEMYVDARGTSSGVQQRGLNVIPGETYELKFKYKLESGRIYPRLGDNDSNRDFEGNNDRVYPTNGEWKEYHRVFIAPSSTDFRLVINGKDAEFSLDDIFITPHDTTNLVVDGNIEWLNPHDAWRSWGPNQLFSHSLWVNPATRQQMVVNALETSGGFQQTGISVEAGKTYEFSFDYYRDSGQMKAFIGNHKSNSDIEYRYDFFPKTRNGMESYSRTFTVDEDTDDLRIVFGVRNGLIAIDNVAIREVP